LARPMIHWDCERPPTRSELAAIARGIQSGQFRNGDHVRPAGVVRTRRRSNPAPTAAEYAYTDFHWGREPRRKRTHVVPTPLEVFELGKLRAVEYQARKGDEDAIWVHKFGWPYPTLTGTPCGRLGPILGGNARVTSKGIVG
jgi:hypothetical protein